METKISTGVSYLLHPLLIPFYTLILLMKLNIFINHPVPLAFTAIMLGSVLLTTFIVPVFLTWFLTRLGLVSSFFLVTREERIYPILAVAVFYYVTYYLLRGTHISNIFSYYMLGATLLAILALIINFYFKISLHMIGIGSFTGFFTGLSLHFGINFTPEILSGIIVAGIIGYARLKTDSHDANEIYSGFAMGAVTMTLLLILI